MPFTEDFTCFTNPAMFGSVATYTPVGSSSSDARQVNGIFQRDYEEAQGMEGSAPMFACATADVATARHGDTLVIDSVAYVVRGVRPDGTGWTRLILELADE